MCVNVYVKPNSVPSWFKSYIFRLLNEYFLVLYCTLSKRLKPLEKLGGGGGVGGSKNKNQAGETERIRAPKKFENKNSCTDFSIEKIIS